MVHENFIQVHAINEYQLRLDVQHFLWPAYYIVWFLKVGCGHSPEVIQLARPSYGNVAQALERLRYQGLVQERSGDGWVLTPAGIRAAREAGAAEK